MSSFIRPSRLLPFLAFASLSACAASAFSPTPPSVVVPDLLRAPASESLLRTLSADGVQVYECRAKQAQAGGAEWVFVAPEARLSDAEGKPVGKHYAGPTWEALDGSKVVGTVKAKVDAPEAGAIPWLLLETHAVGPRGAFSKVTSVQRVATVGGVAPADGCTSATIGQSARVPYRAQYALYANTL